MMSVFGFKFIDNLNFINFMNPAVIVFISKKDFCALFKFWKKRSKTVLEKFLTRYSMGVCKQIQKLNFKNYVKKILIEN